MFKSYLLGLECLNSGIILLKLLSKGMSNYQNNELLITTNQLYGSLQELKF